MPQWQERADHGTDPVILTEHAMRYRFVAPLVADSTCWADLGCGTGVPAAVALGSICPPNCLLVDVEEDAVARACTELPDVKPASLVADLADPSALHTLREQLLSIQNNGPGVITCFETLEHLDKFTPLVELLVELSDKGFDIALSVPNDAFFGVDNPYHVTRWGSSALEELRQLLPPDHRVAYQRPLHGSCIQPLGEATDDGPLKLNVTVEVDFGPNISPGHFLVMFGPRVAELQTVADASPIDTDARRAWELARSTDLEYFRTRDPEVTHWETEAKRLQAIIDEKRGYRAKLGRLTGKSRDASDNSLAGINSQ